MFNTNIKQIYLNILFKFLENYQIFVGRCLSNYKSLCNCLAIKEQQNKLIF